jgi:hypothetical protein
VAGRIPMAAPPSMTSTKQKTNYALDKGFEAAALGEVNSFTGQDLRTIGQPMGQQFGKRGGSILGIAQ